MEKLHQSDTTSKSSTQPNENILNSSSKPSFISNDMSDANFPIDSEGRTYHLNTKKGDVANRILSVGSTERAKLIAQLIFTDKESVKKITSYRGFITYTGMVRETPVSIIATGMGFPMMDFVVREARYCVEGPMLIIRFGTCGTPSDQVSIGTVVISDSACIVSQNYDHWSPDAKVEFSTPYSISHPFCPSSAVAQALLQNFQKVHTAVSGLCASAGSFYSSQGRQTSYFDDQNENLIEIILKKYSKCKALEMETGHLFHLARLSKQNSQVFAGAAMIVLAQRASGEFLPNAEKHRIEALGGQVIAETLVSLDLNELSTD